MEQKTLSPKEIQKNLTKTIYPIYKWYELRTHYATTKSQPPSLQAAILKLLKLQAISLTYHTEHLKILTAALLSEQFMSSPISHAESCFKDKSSLLGPNLTFL